MLIGPNSLPAKRELIASEEWLLIRASAKGLPPVTLDQKASISDEEYPLRISWDGILVDDAGFDGGKAVGSDIVGRVCEVLSLILTEQAHDVEQEVCDILGITELRQYFRNSSGFFQDHLKRYSKSRRKAPIYWQLATPSTSYSVWLYIHAFTGDTLYQVQDDYIAPKLQYETRRLETMRSEAGPNPGAKARRDLAAQEAFVDDLCTFLDEVKRVAPLWNPDLDDGVIINFAPLWRLVPQHRAWQREVKATWDALCAGEYDWAHLALHLWPERVVPKCAADCSLAIVHGLEETFWEEDEDGKWQPRLFPLRPIEELVSERSSAAVKAALQSLMEAPAFGVGIGRAARRAGRGSRS